jgi:hypothetical protein
MASRRELIERVARAHVLARYPDGPEKFRLSSGDWLSGHQLLTALRKAGLVLSLRAKPKRKAKR